MKYKWNISVFSFSVHLEIIRKCGPPPEACPFRLHSRFLPAKVTIPFPKFLFSSPTSLRMAKCFDLVGDFASIDQCCSIFSWLVPLVSELLVWLNGKHPCVIDLWNIHVSVQVLCPPRAKKPNIFYAHIWWSFWELLRDWHSYWQINQLLLSQKEKLCLNWKH